MSSRGWDHGRVRHPAHAVGRPSDHRRSGGDVLPDVPGAWRPWDLEKPLPRATVESLNRQFGLDKPLWINPGLVEKKWNQDVRNPLTLGRAFLNTQFFNYMIGVAHFDLGPSYASKGAETVQGEIFQRFPVSLKIGMVGLVFAVLIGVPLGVLSALKQNTWIDYVSLFTSTIGVSIPTFVSGLLLLIVLTRTFGISPIRRPEEWNGLSSAYLLPGIVLGASTMSYVARLTRASMLEVKRQDYVRTAEAKGLSGRGVVGRHMLRNALIPIITILGPAAADLVTGSIIIETIFNAPGLGRQFVDSIAKRDYSMIMGTAIFYALLIALANVTVDLSYGFVDPRIRARR